MAGTLPAGPARAAPLEGRGILTPGPGGRLQPLDDLPWRLRMLPQERTAGENPLDGRRLIIPDPQLLILLANSWRSM